MLDCAHKDIAHNVGVEPLQRLRQQFEAMRGILKGEWLSQTQAVIVILAGERLLYHDLTKKTT